MRGRDRFALGGCAATLAWAGLALGGAVRWAALIGSALAILSALPYATSRRSPARLSTVLLLIGVAIGLTALQLVPLPVAFAELVAASKLELVTDNAAAWGDPTPGFVLASFDPPATLVELAKLAGYAALAFTALRLASHQAGRRALAMIVVFVALAVTAISFAHEVVGAEEIYGVFGVPSRPALIGPLINENHLASLMTIAAAVALGLAIASAGVARVLWLGALAVCSGMVLFSGSRGGAIALAAALVATIAVLLVQRRPEREQRPTRMWIPAATVAACATILLVVFTADRLYSEFARTNADEIVSAGGKQQIWSKALSMIEDHAWFGIGRGAFEPAFTRWSGVGQTTFSHAENTYLQAIVDWGIPGAAALALAFSALAVAATRRWQQSPLEAGALGALVSLAIHEIADFSLELPVIAGCAILLLAVLLAPRLEPRSDSSRPLLERSRPRRVALLTLAATVCIIASTPLGRSAHTTAPMIEGTAAERLALAHLATTRHPADYLLLGHAAQALLELGDPRAVPIINRALHQNPTHAGLHRLAAIMLLRGGRATHAQSELALAVRHAPVQDRSQLVAEVLATFPTPAQAARALPQELALASELVRILTALKQPAVAFEYARLLALVYPQDSGAHLLLARSALATKRTDLAITAASEAVRLQGSIAATIVLAKAVGQAGDRERAMKLLEQARASADANGAEQVEILGALADHQTAAGAFEAAAATLDDLLLLSPDRRGQIDVHRRRAALFDRRGDAHQAAYERKQAQMLESEP